MKFWKNKNGNIKSNRIKFLINKKITGYNKISIIINDSGTKYPL
jgi:hypothetical protein